MLKRAAFLIAIAAVALPGTAQAETLTLQFTSVVVKVTSVDRKPKGASKGDRVTQRNKLMNAVRQFREPKGTRVGFDEGTVTWTGRHTERYEGIARLPDGSIRVKGAVRLVPGGGIRIPVVGGTGRYKKATGTLWVSPGEERVFNVYQLRLPGTVA